MKFSRMPSRRIWLSLLGLALLAGFALLVSRSGPLAPTRVTVASIDEGRLSLSLFGIGTVEARRTFMLGPTLAGRVQRVLVDVGESVRAGQLLAEMDPVDLQERTLALDASINRAASSVSGAEAQLRDAQARHALASINATRYVELGQKNFVSAGAVEARQQEQISAQAGTNAAEANLAGARHDMARIRAERDGLRQQRNNVRLLSPVDGIVIARDAEPGSTVVAGQAVVKLIEPASLWVRVRIDQGRSGGLAVGLPAEIVLRSHPTRPLAGKVVRLELVSDSLTEERVALVAFDSVPAGASVGELTEVTLKLPASEPGLLLPNASIKRQAGVAGVWVRSGGLRFVPVEPSGASLDGMVLVRSLQKSALKSGDQVIVYSDKEISAGSKLRIVDSLVERGS
jgi:HlyD family secretion protein